MTERKTLNLRDTTDAEAPELEKKGRGWKISDKRLDVLHDQARDMKRFARKLLVGSCAGFLVGFAALSNAAASAQDNSVMVREVSRPAQGFPVEFRDFLYCRFSEAEESGPEGLRFVVFQGTTSDECADELASARRGLLAALRQQGNGVEPGMLAALMENYVEHVDQAELPARFALFDMFGEQERFSAPAGAWDYYVCMMDRAGSPVYSFGERARPRFENDENCDESREYSRDDAIDAITYNSPETSVERATEMADGFIAEVDRRVADLESSQ